MDFFETYKHLNQVFDPNLADLFSDHAEVTGTIYGEGIEVQKKIKAFKFKKDMVEAMQFAKAASSTDRYTDVQITPLVDGYKIKANRYSFDQCYLDKEFSLELQSQPDKSLKIIRANGSSIEISACKQSIKEDIPAKLQAIAAMQSKKLPIKVDREVEIEKVYADQMSLNYELRMINFDAAEIDQVQLNMNLEPMLLHNFCQNTAIKKDVENGASITQRLYSRDNKQIFSTRFDKKSCAGSE